MLIERITPREAAAVMRLSMPTLYRALRAGDIPARKVGGQWFIPRRTFERFLACQDVLGSPSERAGPDK